MKGYGIGTKRSRCYETLKGENGRRRRGKRREKSRTEEGKREGKGVRESSKKVKKE